MKQFSISLKNTILLILYLQYRLPWQQRLGLALILNQKLKGINMFRTVFFFPHVASLVAVAVVWNLLFHPTLGPINNILRAMGSCKSSRMASTIDWAMPVIIIVSIWKVWDTI